MEYLQVAVELPVHQFSLVIYDFRQVLSGFSVLTVVFFSKPKKIC